MTNNSRRLITYQVAVRSQEPLGCCLLECGNKSCGDITSDKVRNYCSKARKRNFVLCRGRIKSKEDKEDDTLSLNRSLFPSFILIFLLSLAVLGGPREAAPVNSRQPGWTTPTTRRALKSSGAREQLKRILRSQSWELISPLTMIRASRWGNLLLSGACV